MDDTHSLPLQVSYGVSFASLTKEKWLGYIERALYLSPTVSPHDDVIKWKHYPRYWPFVPVNSPHKGQWRGALMFSLSCTRINDWINNCEAGDLIRHHGHYDVSVMSAGMNQLRHSQHQLNSFMIINELVQERLHSIANAITSFLH